VRLCQCGCGAPIPVANFNRPKDGLVKGQQSPARFMRGHHIRAQHPVWWKGDDAGYRALHTYLQKHSPKTGVCEECGAAGTTDYALIKGRVYSRERSDYRELCRGCHMIYDQVVGMDGIRARRAAEKQQQAGVAPSCRCGCGTGVQWHRKHSRWRSYSDGHYSGSARLLRKAG